MQRTSKFIKYLPSFGIEPLVLTGTSRSTSRWAPRDFSHERDFPDGLRVFRTADDGDDPRCRAARLVAEGEKVIREYAPDAIFVTMSPFEDASVAAELAKRWDVPWIADLRDPWALDEFQIYRSRWHRQAEVRRMAASLETAGRIIMNTPEAMKRFRDEFPDLAPKATEAITNGFDPDDFIGLSPRRDDGIFRIVHTGSLHTDHGRRQNSRRWLNPLLGRSTPGVDSLPRSHVFLMKALERWQKADPEVAVRVRVDFAGVTSRADLEVAEKSSAGKLVRFLNFVPHLESLALMRSADLLFLPMHKMPQNRRATIVPGKTYEYIASGRPILAAVPEGDAKDFLQRAGTAAVCDPDDVDGILGALQAAYRAWAEGGAVPLQNVEFCRRFERGRLAEQLAKCFLQVCRKIQT